MKRLRPELLLVVGVVLAGVNHARAGGLQLGGAVGTENYLGLREGDFYDFRNANWLRLDLKADPSESARVVAQLELRNTNFTAVRNVLDLWDRGSVEPVSWRVNEAYAEFAGLVDTEWLVFDLRAGKQILGWGEADGFNPSNIFDVYDLENPLDLKKRIGNVSLRAVFTIADEAAVLEAVVVPRFLPSVVPVELFLGDDPLSSPLMPALPRESLELIEQLGLVLVPPAPESLAVSPPAFSAGEIMAGARLQFSLLGVDWTLSYAHGRDSIPALSGSHALLTADPAQGCETTGSNCLVVQRVDLVYPKVDVIGLDFRTDLWGIGLWGEAALVVPRKLDSPMMLDWGNGTASEVAAIKVIEEDPFVKWVVGGEYTFEGGWYLNLQWVHGFFTEQSGHALHDYLFGIVRKTMLSERLRFEISGGGELARRAGDDGWAWVFIGEVGYKPSDAVELVLGGALARGQDGTSFTMFEPLDQVYLKALAYF